MRTLAIGDIHGCLRALDLLLETVCLEPGDLLITLGDYVDRGPDSKGVLDRLIALQDHCQLIALKGNHEVMMLQARGSREEFREWYDCGGRESLRSYGPYLDWETFEEKIPRQHWRFLGDCVSYHEIDTHFFVHANAYPDLPLNEQPDFMLFWEKFNDDRMRPHESGKIMVCGHTPQRSGKPLDIGHAICIDTWAYGNGWLTCLDVKSGQYWQANQQGQTRSGLLDDCF